MSDLDPSSLALTEYERDLVRKAGFGLAVESFIESDVGQYIFSRANELESGCDVALRSVDPTNLRAIVDLQVRVRAAGFLKDWLQEAVQLGLDATREADNPEA